MLASLLSCGVNCHSCSARKVDGSCTTLIFRERHPRRSKDDILAQIRDLQSEMAQLEGGRNGGAADVSNKSN